MADLSTAPALADPDHRGTLDVRNRAVQHIVERAARDAGGTVERQSSIGSLRGGNFPRADITMQGGSARIHVDVACEWPCRIAEVAADVRATVLREAARISGVHVRSVDVTAHAVGAAESRTPERARVE